MENLPSWTIFNFCNDQTALFKHHFLVNLTILSTTQVTYQHCNTVREHSDMAAGGI